MTGAYLRVERGKWINLEVEYLTDEERENCFKGRSNEEMIRWLNLVCNELVKKNIYGKSEIEEVRKLGEKIGYGQVMMLCEMLWYDEVEGNGSNFSVGCCTAFLVDCPCGDAVACAWCVGSRRVTKKVAEAMAKENPE